MAARRIVELAISTEEGGKGRKKRGDILAVREPSVGVGLLEMSRHLWLRVFVSDSLAWSLATAIGEKRRRYYIPLPTLSAALAAAGGGPVDTVRLLDPAQVYQPCLPVDASGLFLPGPTIVLDSAGLIFDRTTGLPVGDPA